MSLFKQPDALMSLNRGSEWPVAPAINSNNQTSGIARQQQPKSDRSALSRAMETALLKRDARSLRRQLTLSSCPPSHDFSSNDFLSLSHSPIFKSRYLQYLNAFPSLPPPLSRQTLPGVLLPTGSDSQSVSGLHNSSLSSNHPQGLASTGSRLLDGNSTFALCVESQIARFHHAQSALLFNSGYDANLAVFSTIPQKDDVVLYDALVHASVHDGMRLSRAAECVPFPHNSVSGLRDALEYLVKRDEGIRDGSKSVFVAVESVYSMEGDIAPLRGFIEVLEHMLGTGDAEERKNHNGYLIVDEAHATGVYGPSGRGVAVAENVHDRCLIRVHTFGKALAAHGAAVLSDFQTRDYLINYARSLIYTTALPFTNLAAIRTAYELLENGCCDQLRDNLNHLIEHTHRTLFSLGSKHRQNCDEVSIESSTISVSTINQLQLTAETVAQGSTDAAWDQKPEDRASSIPSGSASPKAPPQSPGTSSDPSIVRSPALSQCARSREITLQHSATSPIFSLLTPRAVELAAYCQAKGCNVRAVRPPTVPRGTERVRLCLHAGNTVDAVGQFTATVARWVAGDDLEENKTPARKTAEVSDEETAKEAKSGGKIMARL